MPFGGTLGASTAEAGTTWIHGTPTSSGDATPTAGGTASASGPTSWCATLTEGLHDVTIEGHTVEVSSGACG